MAFGLIDVLRTFEYRETELIPMGINHGKDRPQPEWMAAEFPIQHRVPVSFQDVIQAQLRIEELRQLVLRYPRFANQGWITYEIMEATQLASQLFNEYGRGVAHGDTQGSSTARRRRAR